MRAINVLLAVLVSLLIALLVLEGGLRLVGMGPQRTVIRFDASLGWSKEPGAVLERSTREFDVVYEINEEGLRDDPMPSPAKPAGAFRVAMLGDSFTFGLAVDRADLFVDQLERWWRAEGRVVDVVNAGTEGWSTDQEVLWLAENGERFAPDLVVLLPYENDLYWNGQPAYFEGKRKPLYAESGELETGAFPEPPGEPWWESFAVGRLFRGRPADWDDHHFVPGGGERKLLKEWGALLVEEPDFMAPALARTRGALRALKEECDALGARCVVAPIPSHSAIDPDFRERFGKRVLRGLEPDAWSPDRPVETFLELAAAEGLETLDVRAALRAEHAAGVELYNKVDWHVNPAGNEALARALHDGLDELGAFPEAYAATQRADLPHHEPERPFPFWAKLYVTLFAVLSVLYGMTYRDEPLWRVPLQVGGLLALVFAIAIGGTRLVGWLSSISPMLGLGLGLLFVFGVLTFVAYKLGRRLGTIVELFTSFVRRGHWYLMPLVVVLLTVGSLLVVAASSPLVAPFIYTLF